MVDGAVLVKGLADRVEHKLHFEKSQAMVGFCGPNDRTLTALEQDLGIQFIRDGSSLLVQVSPDAAPDIMKKLGDLRDRAHAGEAIDRCMALGGRQADDAPLFKGRRKSVEPRTANQAIYAKSLMKHELNLGLGPAGTGKTYMAVAAGVHFMLSGEVDKLILSRPAVEAGEKLGYLPGDMKDKVDPFMQPLYDALNDLIPPKQVEKMIEERQIEIAPLAFMRGRTLSNAFILLDEAQNATPMQMKMFLTRFGQNSRMVITGDPGQTDLPWGTQSGLIEAHEILKGIPEVGISEFTAEDVVRHPLVAKIIKAYDKKRS